MPATTSPFLSRPSRFSLSLALCGWLAIGNAQGLPESVEVKSGDTASQLAIAHLPKGVTLDQMLVALLQANPKAFIDSNVNLLKAGALLQMPTAAQAQQMPPAQARQAVIEQTRQFIRQATRMAESVATVGAQQKAREMSGKVAPDETPTERAQPEQDKLVLSKQTLGASEQEARIASERQARDAQSQLGMLQQNIKELQALAKGSNAQPAAQPASAAATASASTPRSSLLRKFSSISATTLALGALLLVLLALALYWALRSRSDNAAQDEDEDRFWVEPASAPAPSPAPARTLSAVEARGLAQMASIDLNLDTEPPRTTSVRSR